MQARLYAFGILYKLYRYEGISVPSYYITTSNTCGKSKWQKSELTLQVMKVKTQRDRHTYLEISFHYWLTALHRTPYFSFRNLFVLLLLLDVSHPLSCLALRFFTILIGIMKRKRKRLMIMMTIFSYIHKKK